METAGQVLSGLGTLVAAVAAWRAAGHSKRAKEVVNGNGRGTVTDMVSDIHRLLVDHVTDGRKHRASD